MKRQFIITTTMAITLGVVTNTLAEDTLSLHGNVYKLSVTSGYSADRGSAYSESICKCVRLLAPAITGKDLKAVSVLDQHWIQHQLSESWSSLDENVHTRRRAYGTLYKVTVLGQLSLDVVQKLRLDWSERIRKRRLRTSVAVLVPVGLLIGAPFLFLHFDRLTNGDRRLILAGVIVTSFAACGFTCLRVCVA